MSFSPELEALQQFVGFLQPTGLLVAPRALEHEGAVLRTDAGGLPGRLAEVLSADGAADVPRFFSDVLGWPLDAVQGAPGGPALPEALELLVEERGLERVRPTYALPAERDGDPPALLVQVTSCDRAPGKPDEHPFDRVPERGHGWLASPHAKFERLLRHLGAPAGVLTDGVDLRLIYAPRGEPSGHGTWTLADLVRPAARPLAAGLHLLLGRFRVFDEAPPRRLVDLLAQSREYQNTVSNELSQQVLDALWELLAGFQQSGALADVPPREVYAGLLKTLMRLVFLLYAEDQDLLPTDPLFRSNYSVRGLFSRLERDAGLHPDTMDERYGAWAALLTLFRLVHDGGGHGAVRLPRREGELFNPYRHPFLEGARLEGDHPRGERFIAPRVPDGCVFRVLKKLLVVHEERLSYRTLDVEQIGSVYESMMGFSVERASGHVVALEPKDVVVDLDLLLELDGKKRLDHVAAEAEAKLADKAAKAVREAETREDLVAAFGRRLSRRTPRPLPPGSYYLQPGLERRRSGSHYTPRALTRPIVEKTLEPVLAALGPNPTPEQILELKVCDPAMGSGAFLVEACRQIAERLVASWQAHESFPRIPADETPELYARRLVAQRCLYGVDRNEFAVSLAKLSLWLVTLARDHAFTFIDHALRHGDSLVGLDLRQIADFQWHEPGTGPLFAKFERTLFGAQQLRDVIGKGSVDDVTGKAENLKAAENQIADLRRRGDLLLAAFFGADKDRARDNKRLVYRDLDPYGPKAVEAFRELRTDPDRPFVPFHWPVEFPEVFGRDTGGFDALVGNPPFSGKNGVIRGNLPGYLDWLKRLHEGSHGNADLVAHFFRRAFAMLREGGTFGLIATNTIAQGDTRESGLARLALHEGGTIYSATKRFKWPGLAAVVVSVVHVRNGDYEGPRELDGQPVERITAYLTKHGGDESPRRVAENDGLSFIGSYVLGMGFTFDDQNLQRGASPLSVMHELIAKDPRNAERIFPYIGGEEVNTDPEQKHDRYVINFGEMREDEARAWPDLMKIVEERVKPERLRQSDRVGQEFWWRLLRERRELLSRMRSLSQACCVARVGDHASFAFIDSAVVPSEQLVVFPIDSNGFFAVLQSRVHEVWARFFGSSMKDDLRYTPSDCFETFPLPPGWRDDAALEDIGRRYYAYRAELMKRTQKGLTKTYNRFHDRMERHPEIVELRRLHAEMDRAVLHAYGWDDIPTACDFFPDWLPTSDDERVPYRYRWPDDVRDEVLGKLLAENQKREGTSEKAKGEEAEDASTTSGEKAAKGAAKAAKKPRGKKGGAEQGSLL